MVKNYISVKMVKAEPCKAWKDFKGHITGDEGYKIYLGVLKTSLNPSI